MIKINLLGVAAPTPEAPAGERASKALQAGVFIGALVVCFGTAGLFYKLWNRSIDALNVELAKQQAEQARLAAIKIENLKYEQERQLLEQRIHTIEMLKASRVGPIEFMNALGDVVNRTKDLYLFSVSPQGERVVMRGETFSVNSVATLLFSMKTSGYFDDVQLRQFYEDDDQDRVSYKFNMDFGCKQPSAAAPAKQVIAGTSTPTPSRRPGT
jgi:Tfp pilus assembly protein PilN